MNATPRPVASVATVTQPDTNRRPAPLVTDGTERPRLTLVISDVHYGSRWRPLWSGFLAWLEDWGGDVDLFINNGDFFDHESVSLHGGNANPPSFVDEHNDGMEGLRQLAALTPNAKHAIHRGNHDEWIDRYITARAPALTGVFDLSRAMDDVGWEFVDAGEQKVRTYHGFLRSIHGDQIAGTSGGIVVAKTILDQGLAEPGYLTLVGHHHRFSVVGRRWSSCDAVAVSLPAMITPDPKYMKNTNAPWSYGFVVIESFAGHWRLEQIIANREGKFLYRGRVYGGAP